MDHKAIAVDGSRSRGPVRVGSLLGSNLWFVWTLRNPYLLVSHDGGRTFSKLTPGAICKLLGARSPPRRPSRCGASVRPGTRATRFVQPTGAGTRVNVGYPGGMSNAVQIFPISDSEAIFYPLFGDIWLTRSGGRPFIPLLRVPQNPQYTCQVALASGTTWLVLGHSGYETNEPNLMWRTTNSGRSWQPVQAPNVPTTPLDQFQPLSVMGFGFIRGFVPIRPPG